MTTFEALVSISQTVLRHRGEWPATDDQIDLVVNQCADLLPEPTRQLCDMAVAEIKRRGTPA